MARLGESNTPEHLAGEGNGGQQLAALLGRQGTYSAPASQLPSHAKTIARPETIAFEHARQPEAGGCPFRGLTPAGNDRGMTMHRFWPPG